MRIYSFNLKQKWSKSIKPLSRKADLKNTLKIYIFYYKNCKKQNFENPIPGNVGSFQLEKINELHQAVVEKKLINRLWKTHKFTFFTAKSKKQTFEKDIWSGESW